MPDHGHPPLPDRFAEDLNYLMNILIVHDVGL